MLESGPHPALSQWEGVVGGFQQAMHINSFRARLVKRIAQRKDFDTFAKDSAFGGIDKTHARRLSDFAHKKIAVGDEILGRADLAVPDVHRVMRAPIERVEGVAVEDGVAGVVAIQRIGEVLPGENDRIRFRFAGQIESGGRDRSPHFQPALGKPKFSEEWIRK